MDWQACYSLKLKCWYFSLHLFTEFVTDKMKCMQHILICFWKRRLADMTVVTHEKEEYPSQNPICLHCILWHFFTPWHFLFLSLYSNLSPAAHNQFSLPASPFLHPNLFVSMPLVWHYPVLTPHTPLSSAFLQPAPACMWWVQCVIGWHSRWD